MLLTRKENSPRCNRKFLRVLLRYRFVYRSKLATSTRENINSLPFRLQELSEESLLFHYTIRL